MPEPYTTREGWIDRDPDHAPMWSAGSARMWPSDLPCLVVTGDLDAARRRLAPPDDAAIERAARALYAYGSSLMAVDWDRATETTRMQHSPDRDRRH